MQDLYICGFSNLNIFCVIVHWRNNILEVAEYLFLNMFLVSIMLTLLLIFLNRTTALLTDLVAKLQKVTRQFHRNLQDLDKEEYVDYSSFFSCWQTISYNYNEQTRHLNKQDIIYKMIVSYVFRAYSAKWTSEEKVFLLVVQILMVAFFYLTKICPNLLRVVLFTACRKEKKRPEYLYVGRAHPDVLQLNI